MDFRALLEDHDVLPIKKTDLELQTATLDQDHDISRRVIQEDQDNMVWMNDEDSNDEHGQSGDDLNADLDQEEQEEEEEDQQSDFESRDSEESVSDVEIVYDSELVLIPSKVPRITCRYQQDGSFLPDVEKFKPPPKEASIFSKVFGHLKKIFSGEEIDLRWLQPIADNVPEIPGNEEALQLEEDENHEERKTSLLPVLNYEKTIQIFLQNGLHRYNVDLDINTFTLEIKIVIKDGSKSSICIWAGDDAEKSYQKIVRSRKAEMKNKTPRDVMVHLSNGLRLSNIDIQTANSEILIKIQDKSWKEFHIEVDDYYPVLRKVLRKEDKLIVKAELCGDLSLSDVEVKCGFNTCPEVEFLLQEIATPILLNISDGTDTLKKIFNHLNPRISVGKDAVPNHKQIKIQLTNIKIEDIEFCSPKINLEEKRSIAFKILTKNNVQCIIFDQDRKQEVYEVSAPDSQVKESKDRYPTSRDNEEVQNHNLKVILSNDVETIEDTDGKQPKPTKKQYYLTHLTQTPKKVLMTVPSELNLNDITFSWDEYHDLVYNTLKQKITIVVKNGKVGIVLKVKAGNAGKQLQTKNEDLPIKTIDLHLPFVLLSSESSTEDEYSIFELDVHNNSPISLKITNGEETLKKMINVSVNIAQESRRTQQKFERSLHALEEAIKAENAARLKKNIEDCVIRIVDVKYREKTIEEKLEETSKEAIESITDLCVPSTTFTFKDNLVFDEEYFKTTHIESNEDVEFYGEIRNRLETLRNQDERAVLLTGKPPTKHIEKIERLLRAIEHLKPTASNFEFQLEDGWLDSEETENLKEEIDESIEEEVQEERNIDRELTVDELDVLENLYPPLRGKLLHGVYEARKPRRTKETVREGGERDDSYLVEVQGDVSIEIENDIEIAFKYYNEFVPSSARRQENEGKEGTSKDAEGEGGTEGDTEEDASTEATDLSAKSAEVAQPTKASKVEYFQCEYCPQKTAGKNHLINHQKNHNQLKKEPDYFCLFCGRRHKTNGWLQKHIDERHKDKVVIYGLLNIDIVKLHT